MSDVETHRTAQGLSAFLLVVAASGVCAGAEPLRFESLPPLPEPVSNNAVALAETADGPGLISAMGLGPGKTWRDVHARVFFLPIDGTSWRELQSVPGSGGRLAGTSVLVAGEVLVIGGYTVAADHSESSVPRVQRLRPASGSYAGLAPMPVPVDDAVALVYRDRFVYLVSGWHDSGNVNLVQLYDASEDRWVQATPFPGRPVFGHAGGMVGGTMVICDGVAIGTLKDRPRVFEAEASCFVGTIDPLDPRRIEWRRLDHHGGPALYRMAATGSQRLGSIVFAGGSANPYNYDGIGYNGMPSEPSARVFAYHVADGRWEDIGSLPEASMDHRGLVEHAGYFYLIGGMTADQQVSDRVVRFRLPQHNRD